ncbi:hypothetical protein C8J57DRAFT_1260867 [Mycena rebaudengoi]|nr:hypothetical protein C8J57DRAFT_1260867 [Mycena rebaudengoi]
MSQTIFFFLIPVRGRLLGLFVHICLFYLPTTSVPFSFVPGTYTYPSTPPNCPRKSSAAATQSVLHVLLLPRPLEQRNITFAGTRDTQGRRGLVETWVGAERGVGSTGPVRRVADPFRRGVLDEKVRGTLHNTGVPANLSLKLDFNRIQPNLRLTEEHDKDKDTRIPSSREYQDKLLYIGRGPSRWP